jgi:hypothetical protein
MKYQTQEDIFNIYIYITWLGNSEHRLLVLCPRSHGISLLLPIQHAMNHNLDSLMLHFQAQFGGIFAYTQLLHR